VGASDVDDLKDRLHAIESSHNETAKLVAVLASEMAGIRWLLRLILGTIIVGIIGAFITAWVQIPKSVERAHGYAPVEPPK
jgi:hypothetical protein